MYFDSDSGSMDYHCQNTPLIPAVQLKDQDWKCNWYLVFGSQNQNAGFHNFQLITKFQAVLRFLILPKFCFSMSLVDVGWHFLCRRTISPSILTAIFPGEPGLAGTRMSPFWILLELSLMEVVVKMGVIRRAKLKSDLHHQQTNTHLSGQWE